MKTSPSKKRKIRQTTLEKNSDYSSLLSRLAHIRSKKAPTKLMEVLSQAELNTLIGYLDSNEGLKSAGVRRDTTQISRLQPGAAYRLHKKRTKLPRTMTVLRHPKGEYSLIAETKSKLAQGVKRTLEKEGGSFKSGKPCWRLDNFSEYFNLVTKLKNKNAQADIKEEVAISQDLASEFVNETQLGPIFAKNGINQVSVYSPRAIGTLGTLIKSNSLTQEQIQSLSLQLLKGLKYIHDRSFIHQDLKPANILVYGDAKQGYYLKYTDFGNSCSPSRDIESLSTWEYASPEIVKFYSDEKSSQYAFFQECQSESSTYGALPTNDSIAKCWGKPHKANDIWAAGIIIFEMRQGRLPGNKKDSAIINNDPLLSKMLAPTRRGRVSIDDAINLFEQAQKVENGPSLKRKRF